MNELQLGHCSRVHGIKGEFQLRLFNDEGSVLEDGMQVLLKPKDKSSQLHPQGELMTIEKIRFGNRTIVKFSEVKDRNQAESYLPFELFIDRSLLPQLSDDEVYLEDLPGFTLLNEAGEELGNQQILLLYAGARYFDSATAWSSRFGSSLY